MTQSENICNRCSGTGRITCPACGGSGKAESVNEGLTKKEVRVVSCASCHGSGERTCGVCGGSGKK